MSGSSLDGEATIIMLDHLDGSGARGFVTTRHGGVSEGPYASLNLGLHVGDDDEAVIENRRRVAACAEVGLDDLVFMDQVHGTRVAVVGDAERGRGAQVIEHALTGTDAVVTTTAGLRLCVMVADCAPVVLVDQDAGVLGLAHAGWRGLVAGVLPATVRAMVGLGAQIERLRCVIGPSIDLERFEVGEDVAEQFRTLFGPSSSRVIHERSPRPHIDLSEACVLSLEAVGVRASEITASAVRTDDVRLFSDRSARPCGRFGVVAWLEGPEPGDRQAVASGDP